MEDIFRDRKKQKLARIWYTKRRGIKVTIETFRRKIVAGKYELTQHAKDEAATDNLDTEDEVALCRTIIANTVKDRLGSRRSG